MLEDDMNPMGSPVPDEDAGGDGEEEESTPDLPYEEETEEI